MIQFILKQNANKFKMRSPHKYIFIHNPDVHIHNWYGYL